MCAGAAWRETTKEAGKCSFDDCGGGAVNVYERQVLSS